MKCEQEMCDNWTGFGCICEVLQLRDDQEEVDVPTDPTENCADIGRGHQMTPSPSGVRCRVCGGYPSTPTDLTDEPEPTINSQAYTDCGGGLCRDLGGLCDACADAEDLPERDKWPTMDDLLAIKRERDNTHAGLLVSERDLAAAETQRDRYRAALERIVQLNANGYAASTLALAALKETS